MGVTLKNPAADLVAFVASATALDASPLVDERDLFAGDGYPLPQGAVANFLNVSGAVDPYINGASAKAYARASVQVLVYSHSGRDGAVAGEALTFRLAGLLQQAVVTGYVSVRLNDMPTRVGEVKANRLAWSFNLTAEYRTA